MCSLEFVTNADATQACVSLACIHKHCWIPPPLPPTNKLAKTACVTVMSVNHWFDSLRAADLLINQSSCYSYS